MGKKQADRAVATTSGAMRTAEEMASTGTTNINALTASPSTANAPGVKAALALWATENANLDANNKKKADLDVQRTQVAADEITIMRRWGLRRGGVLHEVNVECDGSKEKVQAFNLPVILRVKGLQATVPENVRQGHTCRNQGRTAFKNRLREEYTTSVLAVPSYVSMTFTPRERRCR